MQDIIVFGRGAYYKKKKSHLMQQYRIVAFLDNHTTEGEFFENIPVRQPGFIPFLPDIPIFVMVSHKYMMEIFQQLLSLNVPPERVFFGITLAPAWDDFEKFLGQNKAEIEVTTEKICMRVLGKSYTFSNADECHRLMRIIQKESHPYVELLSKMPTIPASRQWGYPFGHPIDRYYIEHFLQDNKQCITGDVLEVADNRYTHQFGHDIRNAYALHVYGEGNTIKGNLATGEGITDNLCDCFICTQTLQFIFDLRSVAKNMYRLIKPNGKALVTVPGISQMDMDGSSRWGEAWRFTKQALQALLEESFGEGNVAVQSYGNVKTAICFLYGMCQEDLTEEDFSFNDEMFPLILTAVCKKIV